MIDGAWALMEPLAVWLTTYLLHSTVLVGAVWLGVRLRVVRASRTEDFLWKVALLGGIATSAGATLRPSLARSAPAVREVEVRVRAAGREEAIRWKGRPPPPSDAARRANGVRLGEACGDALAGALRSTGGSLAGPGADLDGVASVCLGPPDGRSRALVLVWLIVGAVGLGLDLRRRRTLGRVLRGGLPMGPQVRRALERVAPESAPLPGVRVSDLVTSPCVLGATIVLPARCETELSPAELEAMLAHEWGHISRRDGDWMGIADAVVAILWIQPLNRLARRRLRQAAELVCDDWAVDRTGRATDLARSIWRVAVWTQARPGLLPVSTLAGGSGRGLSGRVRRILGPDGGRHRDRRGRRWAAALLLAVPLTVLPVRSPRGAHAVVLAQERVVSGRAPGEEQGDSFRLEVRAVRLP